MNDFCGNQYMQWLQAKNMGLRLITPIFFFGAAMAALAEPEKVSVYQQEDLQRFNNETIHAEIVNFRNAFTSYEKRVSSFIDSFQKGFTSMRGDSSDFLDVARTYMNLLHNNKTEVKIVKFRAECVCEGQSWTPCPDRCMDSCRYFSNSQGEFVNDDNCTSTAAAVQQYESHELLTCKCFDGSSRSCGADGNLSNCFDYRAELVTVPEPCFEHADIDQSKLEEAFLRFSELLTEPLRSHLRQLRHELSALKQEVDATEEVGTLSVQICEERSPDDSCYAEAGQLMLEQMAPYKDLKKNITMEMIKVQKVARMVKEDIHSLKEQTLKQITAAIKNYTCCLNGLNFEVKDYDCKAPPSPPRAPPSTKATTTTTVRPLWRIATARRDPSCLHPEGKLCDNGEFCYLPSHRCDGRRHCRDGSDEISCVEESNEYEWV